jgi:hypothetical protein
MLWVYASTDIQKAYKRLIDELPASHIKLSDCMASELPAAVGDVCNHHTTAHISLGYLDPLLMLHPMEEARLRRGFEKCTLSIVVSNPYLLPLSWKNAIERLIVL